MHTTTASRLARPLLAGLVALAGALIGSGGRVEADPTCDFTGSQIQAPNSFSCAVGDKTFHTFEATTELLDATFQISQTNTPSGPLHTLSVNRVGGFSAGASGTVYSLVYKVTAVQPTILEVLTSAGPATPPTDGAFTASLLDLDSFASADYTVPGLLGPGTVDITTIIYPTPVQDLDLQAELNVMAGSSTVVGWTQSIQQVPAPLPLLGVGAAWGASRRLRRRTRLGSS